MNYKLNNYCIVLLLNNIFDAVFVGINYFADLRMTFRQNFFLQDWFRNEFVVGLGYGYG
jgi:hypothetical protein